eukprot:TRINITY_DN20361_c0_g1_i1.p1 TRINITY_DN20361_c0_g1~~TRINITY_DN20361_c0_g1_i1.p1  ORF type:complete len:210 (-),score=21.02 TRINITY_DN20361_c0_g1_i1:84-713(-)
MSCCTGTKKQKDSIDDTPAFTKGKDQNRAETVDISQRAKVVFLGDAGVGKTSIVNRYIREEYSDAENPTIGAAFAAKTHIIAGTNHPVRFELWDTAGQERYHSLAPMYYRGCVAAVLVYEIPSRASFERAQEWIRELQRNCSTVLVLQLVGCKVDLESLREVQSSEAKKYADENNASFMEVSAKTGAGIFELFESTAKQLWERTQSANN